MTLDPAQLWQAYGAELTAAGLNVLAAAAILIFGLWVAAWAGGAVLRLSRKHPRIDDTLAAFFAWLVRYGVTGFVIVAVLNRFGVATTSIVAVIGAGALAIGLALQGTLSNVAAGVMLMLFRPYRLGDFVELSGHAGTVNDINLFTTELTTPQNLRVILPNGLAWGAPMVNFTANNRRRIDLEFGVAYDTDLNHAITVMRDMLAAEPHVLKDPAPQVDVTVLGDFSVTLLVRAWARTSDFLDAKYAIVKAGKEALDANGIVIPFPTALNYELRMEAPSAADMPQLASKHRDDD